MSKSAALLSLTLLRRKSGTSGLGAEFHFEVSQVFARLTETPLIYSAVYQDVRRAVVTAFRISWYRVQRRNGSCLHARQTRPRQSHLPFS